MSYKSWWKSKTIWINTLTLAASILGVLIASELVQENPRLVLILAGIALPVINVLLRWLTDEPISSVARPLDKFRIVYPNDTRAAFRKYS